MSLVAHAFQEQALISYRHAHLQIVNRARLEELSCECYGVVRLAVATFVILGILLFGVIIF